jgi:hypothetical protein
MTKKNEQLIKVIHNLAIEKVDRKTAGYVKH